MSHRTDPRSDHLLDRPIALSEKTQARLVIGAMAAVWAVALVIAIRFIP